MMMPAATVGTDIVLIGGGHAHVEVLRRFAMQPEPGVRLTLIARDVETPYSGMVPGFFAGHYTRAECHIDLRPLCRRARARLYHASAIGLDLERRAVLCAGRPPVFYDFVSIDVGSQPDASAIPGAGRHAVPVKPIDGLMAAVGDIERALADGGGAFDIAVIGAGAGGVELVLALRHRFARLAAARPEAARQVRLTIVEAAPVILPALASGARRTLLRAIEAHKIRVMTEARVSAVECGRLRCDDGRQIAFDRAILVSGAGAAAWLGTSGLAVDAGGFVRVDRHLRSLSHATVFAAGDVASLADGSLAKSGVYAVREGPVLARNLRHAARGRALIRFRPQRRTLALVSTGPRHAVASRGPFALSGRALWRLKDRIDRRFMEKYADLPAMRAEPAEAGPPGDMRCGGCGAKIDRAVLARALAGLAARGCAFAPGPGTGDDAAIVASPPAGEVMVQTVDQFRAFIDDPYLFGRIAATHCLNDIYAMGAQPRAALAMVTLPEGDAARQEDDLVALLAGACEVLGNAGAALVGGHTGEGVELAFGLSVTGHGRAERLLPRSALRQGDALVLTKALGTGVLFNADMAGRAPGAVISAALAGMQACQARASAIMIEHGARAACDVTGFGLAGHLIEMLDASGVDAGLRLDAVPALDGALDLLARGLSSTLAPANRRAAEGALGDARGPRFELLFDPQTAGGLLAGIAAERAAACVEALKQAGYADAAIIGEVTARAGTRARIALSH